MEIELRGMNEVIAKLRAAGQAVSGPGVDKAVRAGARVIKAAMVDRAPVLASTTPGSSALPPGALRDGIRSYVRRGKNPTVALIGPNAKVSHVARFVEYGHRQVSGGRSKVLANGKTRGPGVVSEIDVPAHPFLRPAFEGSIGDAEAAIVASFSETFQEQVG